MNVNPYYPIKTTFMEISNMNTEETILPPKQDEIPSKQDETTPKQEGDAELEPTKDEIPRITVKVVNGAGIEVHFKIKKTTQFVNMFQAFANRIGKLILMLKF